MLRSLFSGICALFNKNGRNAEIDEELRGFLDASVDDKIRRGMSREAALRAARVEMGAATAVKHKIWSAGWESGAESIWQDIRVGYRQFLRSPGFAVVTILSLALGIGANTAIFTLINDLLLKELPVREPQQLVSFGDGSDSGTMEASDPGPYDIFPYEFYRRIEPHMKERFQGVTAFASFPVVVSVRTSSDSAAQQATSHLVSGNFFSVLGAEPLMGRALGDDDSAVEGRNPVAVISHRYWQQQMNGDPNVLGRAILVNGASYSVVGVMPAKFYGVELNEEPPDMWIPITMQPQVTLGPTLLRPDGMFWIHLMGRRREDVSVASAQAWVTAQFQQFLVDRAGAGIAPERRKQIAGAYIPLLPGKSGLSHIRTTYQAPLAALMGMVGIVLLIACANLANLLLAKATSREREFSLRMALGSSRSRIMRQILTETLMLAFAGGALGLALAFWATRVLIVFISGGAGHHAALAAAPDGRVLAFTSAVCVLTGILFGVAPAWRGARSNASAVLNARSAGGISRREGRLLPKTLIIGQVALSLVLLSAAGLLLRTLHNLRSQDLGFDRTNILLVVTNAKFAGYKPEQLNPLYNRILDRVQALPGVRSAAISGGPPMSHGTWGSPIFIDGRPTLKDEDVSTLLNRVSRGYFETLGIPLLRGRTIGVQDVPAAPGAVVVNRTLADRYFPKGDALGRTFKVADPAVVGTWQIVGIVGDTKNNSPADKPRPFAYLALEQLTDDDRYGYVLQVRSVGDPAKITGEVRAALAEIDPNLPVLETATIAEQVDHMIDLPTLISRLSGCFSLLALALASIGLYGVIAYSVVRRTGEIGVRMALGAQRGRVRWMILRESLILLVIGAAIGIPASLAANRVIRAGLFEVSPTDPTTMFTAISIIVVVILGAAWLPALRATRIDPMEALRCE